MVGTFGSSLQKLTWRKTLRSLDTRAQHLLDQCLEPWAHNSGLSLLLGKQLWVHSAHFRECISEPDPLGKRRIWTQLHSKELIATALIAKNSRVHSCTSLSAVGPHGLAAGQGAWWMVTCGNASRTLQTRPAVHCLLLSRSWSRHSLQHFGCEGPE